MCSASVRTKFAGNEKTAEASCELQSYSRRGVFILFSAARGVREVIWRVFGVVFEARIFVSVSNSADEMHEINAYNVLRGSAFRLFLCRFEPFFKNARKCRFVQCLQRFFVYLRQRGF